MRGRQRVGVEEVPGRIAAKRVTAPTAGSRLPEFAQESRRCQMHIDMF